VVNTTRLDEELAGAVSNPGEGATFVVELPSRPTVAAGEQEHLKARA